MKPVWLMLGLLALGVGFVGIVLPLIPTTGPLLLAAYAFARSSDRMHDWLMNHSRFGPFITDFRSGNGIPLKTKITAVTAMTLAFTYSVGWVVPGVPAKAVVLTIGIWAIWYVLRLPTTDRRQA
jgi:hypothetical protein